MVHEVDIYTTLARIGGAEIPTDRPIDGLDQTAFLLGKQERSAREWFPVFKGTDLYAIKWRNWKAHFIWQEHMDDTPHNLSIPKLVDLYINPQERPDESLQTIITHGWVLHGMTKALASFQESLKKYPPIPIGTCDPYTPKTCE